MCKKGGSASKLSHNFKNAEPPLAPLHDTAVYSEMYEAGTLDFPVECQIDFLIESVVFKAF